MKRLLLSTWLLSIPCLAINANSRLIDLPANAAIKFNSDFLVSRVESRSFSPLQSFVLTFDVNLKSSELGDRQAREQKLAVINRLKSLKNFASIESIQCWLDFNADPSNDILIKKGETFLFSAPVEDGTPSETFTKTGKSIRLENYAGKSISGSFANPLLRRLYCGVSADGKDRYNETFLDDLTISQLEALLAPQLELIY